MYRGCINENFTYRQLLHNPGKATRSRDYPSNSQKTLNVIEYDCDGLPAQRRASPARTFISGRLALEGQADLCQRLIECAFAPTFDDTIILEANQLVLGPGDVFSGRGNPHNFASVRGFTS